MIDKLKTAGLTLLCAAILCVQPEGATAHRFSAAESARTVKSSNVGGYCGDGATFTCRIVYDAYCLIPVSHGWRCESMYREERLWVKGRTCTAVVTVDHYKVVRRVSRSCR